jgi:hypothetical protein
MHGFYHPKPSTNDPTKSTHNNPIKSKIPKIIKKLNPQSVDIPIAETHTHTQTRITQKLPIVSGLRSRQKILLKLAEKRTWKTGSPPGFIGSQVRVVGSTGDDSAPPPLEDRPWSVGELAGNRVSGRQTWRIGYQGSRAWRVAGRAGHGHSGL